ncbi:hypothetical protein DBT_2287 [Dissulfuribacter thermophilus]|uniref:Nucleic acid binding, OB-fold, tRNA/helicase-type n=1 Tax=Dissulfuribacter thermophilus TaxID=1156395 RepID=A0A1B9F2X9_9BACT|nr:hypothetical protein [Dissulfuribacter thermophilus]OCC14298.1 hypothetical protein DBT_2287 [Dissulfuribacter thermophilus]
MRKAIIITLLFVIMGATHAISFGPGAANCLSGNQTSVVLQGNPFTIQGVVTAIGPYGKGMSVDTGTDVVTVYGIGPAWYWYSKSIAYPTVGENVSVEGREITLSDGTKRMIATKITIGENSIELRDSKTGFPLWRGGMKRHGGANGFGCKMRGSCPKMGTMAPQSQGTN